MLGEVEDFFGRLFHFSKLNLRPFQKLLHSYPKRFFTCFFHKKQGTNTLKNNRTSGPFLSKHEAGRDTESKEATSSQNQAQKSNFLSKYMQI